MFACMIPECSVTFSCAYLYLDHLTHVHRIPRVYRYECTFSKCAQKLSSWYVFKRHLLGHVEQSSKSKRYEQDNRNQDKTSDVFEKNQDDIDEQSASVSTAPDFSLCDGTYDRNIHTFQNSAVDFTLRLHSETNISRSDVVYIQKEAIKLNSKIVDEIIKMLPQIISNTPQVKFEFESYLEKLKNPFSSIDTEYKFFNYLQEKNIFRIPQIVTVENNTVNTHPETDTVVQEKSHLVMLNIEFQLKTLFSSPNVLKTTLEQIEKHQQSDFITSVVNGSKWREIQKKYSNDIVIPISLYADEFEVNDNLSSHNKKHVVCGVYYSVPVFPEEFKSKLCNIFVAAMVKKVDLAEQGFNMLFKYIVEVFKDIEERGIIMNISGRCVKVRFVTVLLQGDNLGIHQLLQFSFFNSNFYCRFCKRGREQCQHDTVEYHEYVRNVPDYNLDVESKRPSETGLKDATVFNLLPCFHAVENLCVDPMHDFFSSGVCSFGLTAILNYCIYKKQFVSLKTFNVAKNVFSKLALDSSLKRMPDITDTFLASKKERSVVIRTTSSEMKAFLHYFMLIMGPFVPKDDVVWQYCKILVKLTEKMLRRSFSPEDIDELNELCKKHHTMYQDLFGGNLKPKHHFVCHYGSVIKASGPVVNMMNFRNEAKHKGFKEYAHIMSSRRNVCLTLCVKAALQFANDLHNESFLKGCTDGNFQSCNLPSNFYFKYLPLPLPIEANQEIKSAHSVNIKGCEFKVETFITKSDLESIELYEVVDLLVTATKEVFIVGKKWIVGEFDEHFLSYTVEDVTDTFKMFSIDDVDGPPIMIYNVNNKQLFRKKTDFSSIYL